MTYRKINILRKWVIRSGLQQSKLSVVRIVVLGSLMRDPSCPLRTSVILSTLILRGGWAGAANTKKNITSAGTATPTTLRLRLHSVSAHAASVMSKGESSRMEREDLVLEESTRVALITLAAGEESPWHHHSAVTEQVVCVS